MPKKIHVAIVFNEPTLMTPAGRKYISESGQIKQLATKQEVVAAAEAGMIDMSEVGVLEEREHVRGALQQVGYKASLFNMNGDVQRLLDFINQKEPDLIFNLCESVGNQSVHEMHVAGVYELAEIPYTGAPAFALGSCLNKERTKEVLTSHGIRTARFQTFKNITELNEETLELKYPLIVKPSREDASTGIDNTSVVEDFSSLRKRARHIFNEYDQPVLVEEYIHGRELNVAIIGNKRPIVLPISEIDFSKLPAEYPKIVTYNAKWIQGTREFEGTVGVCPAPIPTELEKRLKEIALKCYRVMGLRDYGRIDIRLDKNNTPYVLEVNPNPDLSDDAGFARSARAYGLSFEDTITKIVEYALERMP
ncbi:MAG: ATP-grasp domain-containing protein [Ignavibacteriales bacterium]|nr:ATP-grasp domain-containing protein [Ignavibacteriales bacterium]